MCGIFAAIVSRKSKEELYPYFDTIRHRGPDHSEYVIAEDKVHLGFHRLAVNGLNKKSNQPFFINGIWLIANAEIFNYQQLAEKYNISLQTASDCEILIHLYREIGIEKMLNEIVGEYAFVIYDTIENDIIIARDHLGIRGLYMGQDDEEGIYVASERKALLFCSKTKQFPPRHYWKYSDQLFHEYEKFEFERHEIQDEETHLKNIKKLVEKAVEDRMMSDRKIGCLLSGGLDSSLISSIVARKADDPQDIETFSIGLKGSPDLIAAQEVADHIGTTHHSIELTEQDFISAIEETIYFTGSFDITTIRASVGHQLISNWVKEHSEVKVLFTGETIDEMGSYLYFQKAPCEEAFQEESLRLLKDIHYFDMLRGDRSISSAGLEARVPFADLSFVRYYMGIDPKQRMFDGVNKIEKHLLRKAFQDEDYLPDTVLWRRKNGFSDSVSDKNRSWSTIIEEYVDLIISDDKYQNGRLQIDHLRPETKEAFYFRKIYDKYYDDNTNATPYMWLPKWCGNIKDPSARTLSIYEAD